MISNSCATAFQNELIPSRSVFPQTVPSLDSTICCQCQRMRLHKKRVWQQMQCSSSSYFAFAIMFTTTPHREKSGELKTNLSSTNFFHAFTALIDFRFKLIENYIVRKNEICGFSSLLQPIECWVHKELEHFHWLNRQKSSCYRKGLFHSIVKSTRRTWNFWDIFTFHLIKLYKNVLAM